MLRKISVGRFEVTPIDQAGQKGLRVEGNWSYAPLLAGGSPATMNGVPSGIRPVVAATLGFKIQGMAFVTKGRLQ